MSPPTENRITTLVLRPATPADHGAVWSIFHRVVRTGDTYVYPPETSEEAFRRLWFGEAGSGVKPYVALWGDEMAGTYILKPNFPGLGDHVANASFMVHPDFQGKGIGRAMGDHALQEARQQGYRAMQFNIVVSTNPAVRLWESLGFRIIGTSPQAFRHATLGLVDTYILHRFLD